MQTWEHRTGALAGNWEPEAEDWARILEDWEPRADKKRQEAGDRAGGERTGDTVR